MEGIIENSNKLIPALKQTMKHFEYIPAIFRHILVLTNY